MTDSIYGFDLPHHEGTPCRDLIAIQIPYPPSMVGNVHIPDTARAMGEHGVQAGVIRQMGPMAFTYKDFDEKTQTEMLRRQPASIGDWVLIRWGAGTIFQQGRGILNAIGGWRYLSSYQDVIKVIPADKMPAEDTLEWTDKSWRDTVAEMLGNKSPAAAPAPVDETAGLRERITYPPRNGM